jgi:hypothetical protein
MADSKMLVAKAPPTVRERAAMLNNAKDAVGKMKKEIISMLDKEFS